jgi:hypothetical protein
MDEFRSDDGGELQVANTDAGVTVYQGAAGTQGRGAALLSPDQADQLAASLVRHAQQVRHAGEPSPPALPAEPTGPLEMGTTQVPEVIPE